MSLVGSGLVLVYVHVLCPLLALRYCVYVLMYPPASSRLCLFEKLAALSAGPSGWRPGNPNTCKHSNYPVGLYVRCSCSSSPSHMCLPICSSFTHLSLLYETPTVPLPPDCSPVHRAHFVCPPDSIAGDPLDRGKGGPTDHALAYLLSACEPYV